MRCDAERLPWLWSKHLAGAERLGLFPTIGRHCQWGCIDLDSHDVATASRFGPLHTRHDEAIKIVNWLWERYQLVGYWTPSRGGRGAHVFLLFDPPGVTQEKLHLFLETVAKVVRERGGVDVFPSSPEGRGRGVFMPYFGGSTLIDGWVEPVPADKLECNPSSLLPDLMAGREVNQWPPRTWNLKPSGLPANADRGGRNNVAGAAALAVLRGGGTFRDFCRWDEGNRPPLATDEPKSLSNWWRWAQKRAASRKGQRMPIHDNG